MKTLRNLLHYSLIAVIAFSATHCKEDDEVSADQSNEVKLMNNASLGEILADGNGNTLYYFTRDAKGESACAGGCLNAWPVYYTDNLSLGAGLA